MFKSVVTGEHVKTVVSLANIIWPEHYSDIIGPEQVTYMLGSLHSEVVITQEVESGKSLYFLIQSDGKNVGYIGLQLNPDELFLSKLYLLDSARGLGLGHKAMAFITELARDNSLPRISLTVNKHNTNSIKAYYKMGFTKTGDLCVDIGGGYQMDDETFSLILS